MCLIKVMMELVDIYNFINNRHAGIGRQFPLRMEWFIAVQVQVLLPIHSAFLLIIYILLIKKRLNKMN